MANNDKYKTAGNCRFDLQITSPLKFIKVTGGPMSLKEHILAMLENNQGKILSGEELAKALNVSRNSVWKAINALKKSGIDIKSYQNLGYALSTDTDVFSANRIKSLSSNDIDVVMLEESESSNDVAKSLAQKGAREKTVVVVKKQSAGKGRMGRSFISNEENGIYLSIILRPKISLSQSIYITVIGAVAALEAIENTAHVDCSIKWVNDIYIKEKKVCGILTEASFDLESESLDYAILGIGINVVPPENGFDVKIKDIATSIYPRQAPIGYKSLLCAEVIDRYLYYYNNIESKEYIKIYKQRSNLINKQVDVYRGNEIIGGTVVDIDDEANLVLDTGRNIIKFNSGEARVRKI